MKITRVRLANVRQFIAPLEIRDIGDGLTLISGPNESGKSTVVRAIQAAFFERHKSGSVEDLRPRSNARGGPEVEVDFESGGLAHRLKKRFLELKNCELVIGSQAALRSDEAEDQLATLLGFEFAKKGASKLEHRGIPGLLWVDQGTVQDVEDSIQNASGKLRNALQASLGSIASSSGDSVISAVEAEKEKLLTSGGKPRGIYDEAIQKLAKLETDVAGLTVRLGAYRQQVDRLGILTGEIRADEQEKPWNALREKAKGIQAKLDEINQSRQELARKEGALEKLETRIQELGQLLDEFKALELEFTVRDQNLNDLTDQIAQTAALMERNKERVDGLKKELDEAAALLELARQEDLRNSVLQQISALEPRQEQLKGAIEAAKAAGQEVLRLKAESTRQHIDPVDLKRLQGLAQSVRDLRLKQEVSATRLTYELADGCSVGMNQELLTGHGEALLIMATELTLPGIGRLEITPGGRDLETWATTQAKAEAEIQYLLKQMGVVDLASAEARMEACTKAESEAKTQETLREKWAPQGVEALVEELAEVEPRLTQLYAQRDGLPPLPELVPPSVKQAEAALKGIEKTWGAAREKAEETNRDLNSQNAGLLTATNERDRIRKRIESQEHLDLVASKTDEMRVARQERLDLVTAIEILKGRIKEASPDQLDQDLRRLGKSADEAEKAYQKRKEERRELQGRLEEAGSQNIEENLAAKEVESCRAKARVEELAARSKALDLLLKLLKQKRQDLTQRLLAPLKAKVNHYLGLLFPGATMEIAESLNPDLVLRPDAVGQESMPFSDLSYGAREQLGLICRLAYADLLKEAGRPTLIILDDALVHSDEARLGRMKRVLFDAATRHQVLLFSCHPKAWEDLGATVRTMESIKATVTA